MVNYLRLGALKMTEKQLNLHKFFSEKAKHLQNEIDMEIKKIGGEDMLISREDLIHWVYNAREQVETYKTICRMLEEKAEGVETDRILRELRETMEKDRMNMAEIQRKQEEERKALEQLREEAGYYQQALAILGED